MKRIVPPNLLPSARRYLALQLSANRLGHSQSKFPWADICDPTVARSRVVETCAPYGDASEEVDEAIAEMKDVLDVIERVAVPMLGEARVCDVQETVAGLLRERDMEPVEDLAKRLTLYAEILYVRRLIDERDKSSGDH